MLPACQHLNTVFDLDLSDEPPPGTVARIVVYQPEKLRPLLTTEGTDVLQPGSLARPETSVHRIRRQGPRLLVERMAAVASPS